MHCIIISMAAGTVADEESVVCVSGGPDSPTSPVKDLTTHTRALKLKHQSLEERLELCLLELRKLCIREAVSLYIIVTLIKQIL